MYKSKIFSGFHPDLSFNQWAEKHPNAFIQSFHFSGDGKALNFAICIFYTEYVAEDEKVVRRTNYGML